MDSAEKMLFLFLEEILILFFFCFYHLYCAMRDGIPNSPGVIHLGKLLGELVRGNIQFIRIVLYLSDCMKLQWLKIIQKV